MKGELKGEFTQFSSSVMKIRLLMRGSLNTRSQAYGSHLTLSNVEKGDRPFFAHFGKFLEASPLIPLDTRRCSNMKSIR